MQATARNAHGNSMYEFENRSGERSNSELQHLSTFSTHVEWPLALCEYNTFGTQSQEIH
jgi:hypothetical protein